MVASNTAKKMDRERDLSSEDRARFERNLARGRRIEAARVHFGGIHTQAEFAHRLGISPQRLNQWVIGKAMIPEAFVLQIALMFDVPPEFVMFGDTTKMNDATRAAIETNLQELETFERLRRKYGW